MLHETKQIRILVVEDDPMVLELITTRLSLAGFHTFNARDGYEGLAMLKEVAPAGMVLDINMPRLDGFGVLRGMKALGIAVPTLVTGYYGMNVPYPGFAQEWGFDVSLALMIVLVVILWVQFKRHDWI